jgi:ribosomal protein L19
MHTSPRLAELEAAFLRTDLPDFRVGDTVRVHYRIVEGDKERTQVFQGVVRRARLFYLRELAGKAARVRDEKDV